MGEILYLQTKKTLLKALHDPDLGGYKVCRRGLSGFL
jgi:hypothetical protein